MKFRIYIVVSILILALLFVPSQASASGQVVFTTTANFDAGTKVEAGANYFAENGVDQPSNWINYPNSEYRGGKTFVAWQGDENYSMYVNVYDHTTGTWGTQKRVVNGATENPVTGDGHGSPALLIDSNGYIHIFCCAHDSAIQHYKSNSPGDITSWTEKAELTGALTYPHPVLVGNNIYIFYRTVGLPNGPWAYRKSIDGGETWGTSTIYLDFSATGGTAYIGGTDVYADQIHQFFVYYRNTDGERYNAYEIWLNTTDGNVYCLPNVNNGPVLIKAEADVDNQCEIADTFSVANKNTNFGSVHVDSSGKPYVMWLFQMISGLPTSGIYQVVFSAHDGFIWEHDFDVAFTDNLQNYVDFIIHNSSSIEAFVTTNSTGVGASYEGGDIQRWIWSGEFIYNWTFGQIIQREVSSGKPLTAPIVPLNHHDDFKVYFNQRHFDVSPDAGPANARLYGWGDQGFLFNPAFSFGPRGIQTNTDISSVSTGEFQLASSRGDRFLNNDSDGITFNWGNATSPQYGSGSVIHDWANSARTISNGQLNLTYDADGSNGRWGVVSTAQVSGDFDVSIRTYMSQGCTPTFGCGIYLNIFNEQVLDGFTPDTTTVDGVFYSRQVGTSLQKYTLTNGIETAVGTADFPANPLLWLRIGKIGTAITWYYRTLDSGGWTTHGTTTFGTDNNLFVSLVLWNNDATGMQYGFDNYNIETSVSVNAPGFRPSGSWVSMVQTFTGELAKSVVVGYSGASSTRYIDEIAILDSLGNVIIADGTNRISGTSANFTIDDQDLIKLHDVNWAVQIALIGNSTGSVIVNDVTVYTVRSSLTIAISDAPWVLGFFVLLTLGLMGAWWIKGKRGGNNR